MSQQTLQQQIKLSLQEEVARIVVGKTVDARIQDTLTIADEEPEGGAR